MPPVLVAFLVNCLTDENSRFAPLIDALHHELCYRTLHTLIQGVPKSKYAENM